ncbi:MAG TPA: HAMP domain-containing sensor histidine kinase [Rhodopila sp.]
MNVAQRFPRWLVPIIYAVSGLAFVFDLMRDNTLAYGIIYTPLIATAVFHKSRSSLWLLSGVACLLVIAGAFFPVIGHDLPDVIGNRFLSILAILSTAAFVHHARGIQERLVEETRRAEEAERIKTDVLTNLSEEIRTPLHSLLGVLTLMIVTSRPEQREALRRVRCDGRQLLATIDNLLDLTRIDESNLQRRTVDIAAIARDAAEGARSAASERQIAIALVPGDASGQMAIGDSWAIRRILDNLLANAVRLTPPGGAVSVAVAQGAGVMAASVSDTGQGLPPGLIQAFRDGAHETAVDTLPATGATGLALSRRLARAMNGRLTAWNQSGSGATLTLSLPAASLPAAPLPAAPLPAAPLPAAPMPAAPMRATDVPAALSPTDPADPRPPGSDAHRTVRQASALGRTLETQGQDRE